MFGWLRDRQRRIFSFFDGRSTRSADPMRIWSALVLDTSLEMERHVNDLKSDDNRVAAEACRAVASAVRIAFEVSALSSGGLTDGECIELYGVFNEWLAVQKKSTN